MPGLGLWLAPSWEGTVSELRDRLKLAKDPAIRARSHQYDIMHNHMFVVYGFAAIKNLQIIIGGIVQFNHVAFLSVEHRFDLVILIEVAGSKATGSLTSDGIGDPRMSRARKQAAHRGGRIRFERLFETCPGKLVVAQNDAFSLAFDRSRTRLARIQHDVRSWVSANRILWRQKSDRSECDRNHLRQSAVIPLSQHRFPRMGERHYCAPRCNSFPITTPDAAEIVTGPLPTI